MIVLLTHRGWERAPKAMSDGLAKIDIVQWHRIERTLSR